MKMNIRPTTPYDVQNIKVATYFDGTEKWREMLGAEEQRSNLAHYARSIELENRVIAIFGIAPGPPGCAELWSLLENEAYDRPIAMALAVKRVMPIPWTSMPLHRLQATVECNTEIAEKVTALLEYHGFKKEGVLKHYQPHRDFFLYAKVSETLQ